MICGILYNRVVGLYRDNGEENGKLLYYKMVHIGVIVGNNL